MSEIIIKTDKLIYNLTLKELDFEVYAGSMDTATLSNGKISQLKMGRFIIETCLQNVTATSPTVEKDTPKKIQNSVILNDTELLASAALQASKLWTVWDTQLKKK